MTREGKAEIIAELRGMLEDSSFVYLADSSDMTVAKVNDFRRACFEKGIKVKVAKNTLIQKALESVDAEKGFDKLFPVLKGQSTLMISENPKAPAVLIKEFRKTGGDDVERPLLKAAYIDTDVIIGDDQLDSLTKLRSKEEIIGEVITLLQSPIKNVIGAIKSGGSTVASLVKALEEREN